MNKNLRKAGMTRSTLKNLYNKERTKQSLDNYENQKKFCINILRNIKREYFGNLNVRDISSNKKFLKAKHYLSIKR